LKKRTGRKSFSCLGFSCELDAFKARCAGETGKNPEKRRRAGEKADVFLAKVSRGEGLAI
jgi:hypothetical protein